MNGVYGAGGRGMSAAGAEATRGAVPAAGAPSFVLGTAGHIDHGKSALVKALTGTDPDRLEEEKRRGITIEGWASRRWSCRTARGWAWWTCPATSASCGR